MNTIVPQARQWPIYLAEAHCELLRVLRTPAFLVPSLVFPLLSFLMFGVLLGHGQASRYLLASYTVFGAMAPGLFGFGVGLALDRERGLLTLKRALPAPPAAWLLARVAMAMLVAGTIAALLLALAWLFGKVALVPTQVIVLLALGMFAAVPFCAIGLLIGSVMPASGAPAVVNLLYLVMAVLSGLWMPLSMLPPVFSTLAPVWPAWHLGQLAQQAVGLPAHGAAWVHVAVVLAIAALCLWLAQRRLRRD